MALASIALAWLGSCHALLTAAPDAPSFQVTWHWNLWFQAWSATCFAWTSLEVWHQYRMSRRRLALDLGDPVVTDRFLMWMVFGVSTSVLNAVFTAVHLAGVPGAESLVIHFSSALLGLVSSVAIYLAFLPPAAYLDHVRRRAAIPA